jgi:hypothetical protein
MPWFVQRACRYDREGLSVSAAGYAIRREAQQLAEGCENYRREVESAHQRAISLEELLGPHQAEVVHLRANLVPSFNASEKWLAEQHAAAESAWRKLRHGVCYRDTVPIAHVAKVIAEQYRRADREAVKKKMTRLQREARAYEYHGCEPPVAGRKPLPESGLR